MLIEALFLARDVEESAPKTIVLIDVLRTSATLITMLGRGARGVIVAPRPEDARAHRQRLGACLLCGESGGSKPSDFDHGNSPAEYEGLTLEGRRIVFTSSNCAKAVMKLVAPGRRVFVGSYLNATTVVRAAIEDAERRGADLCFVAAGRHLGTRYGIEDCHCAGFLVERAVDALDSGRLWTDDPPSGSPHRLSVSWALEDSALLALRLYRSFGLDFDRVTLRSGDAQVLDSLGLRGDFASCFVVDTSTVVPEVEIAPEGHLIVNLAWGNLPQCRVAAINKKTIDKAQH